MMTATDEARSQTPPSDPTTEHATPPPTTDPTTDSRNLGMVSHLSALIAFAGVPSFVGPLVVWLLQRDRDEFVAEQAREALNFNLSLLLYLAAGVALSVVTIGLGLVLVIPAVILGAVAWFVLTVIAAMRAADGQIYRYPLTVRLIA